MNKLFRDKSKLLTKKRELYQLLLSMNPDEMTDDDVDLMYMLSKDKQIQHLLSIKKGMTSG